MNALFRHLAMRLWVTALAGGSICLMVLPWLTTVVPPQWLLLPAIGLLATSFVVFGRLMNSAGAWSLRRAVKEAGVWEQAGMNAEAQAAYDRAMGQLDSFWLSPQRRRDMVPWLAARLARFYLTRSIHHPHARRWVAHYLSQYPMDEALALLWLEQLPVFSTHSAGEQETAARVGRRLHGSQPIQTRLMAFYLSSGRNDFEALQTYRRCWSQQAALTEEGLRKLCRLLVESAVLGHWAFQVHIAAFQAGEPCAAEGIAAGLRWLPRDPDHSKDFAVAENLLTTVDLDRLEPQIHRFKPAETVVAAPRPRRADPQFLPVLMATARVWPGKLAKVVLRAGTGLRQWVVQPRAWILLLVPLAAYLIWAAGTSIMAPPPEVTPPPTVVEKEAPVHQDPFTIQVAAYLKSEDARRFVDQLTAKGLEAFWTTAASADRTWYQVKVSHFATKEAARSFGLDLKSKGLIDDFYVANYSGAPPPQPSPGQ
jgi:hypothetical protein